QFEAGVADMGGDEGKPAGAESQGCRPARRRRIVDVLVENELAGALELDGRAVEEGNLQRRVGFRFERFVLVYLVGQVQLNLLTLDRLTVGDVHELVDGPDRSRISYSGPGECH